MHLLTTIIFSYIFFSFSAVCAQGIAFENGNWKDIIRKATKANKPIFVDAYATWCGPCKWMAKNTFTDEKVGSFYTDNYIAYKMDMEKGEGPAFAKRNEVEAYPTLLFFSIILISMFGLFFLTPYPTDNPLGPAPKIKIFFFIKF